MRKYKIPETTNGYVTKDGKVFIKILGKMYDKVPRITKDGYQEYKFWIDGKSVAMKLNRIMKTTFFKCYDKSVTVNHIDGNKNNNSLDNLELMSFKDNAKHGHINGLINNTGSRNGRSKLSEIDVKNIKELISRGWKCVFIAELFNVSPVTITFIKTNRSWTHVPWPDSKIAKNWKK
jgi:hypothetical protein